MIEYDDLYQVYDEIPGYIVGVENGKILVRFVGLFDFNEEGEIAEIGVEELARFFAVEAQAFTTIKTLGAISGDHRPISNLAEELHEVFKQLDPDDYHEACKPYSEIMEPNF